MLDEGDLASSNDTTAPGLGSEAAHRSEGLRDGVGLREREIQRSQEAPSIGPFLHHDLR